MGIVARVGAALQHLWGELANTAAAMSQVIQRRRKFSPETLARTFVLGFLQDPNASDEKLAQFAAQCGVAVTPQAIEQRHTQALVEFLKHLFEQAAKLVVGSDASLAALLERFARVIVLDSSTISLPEEAQSEYRGCGGKNGGGKAALKLQTEWDLRSGAIAHVQVEEGRSPDNASSRQQVRRGPGTLRITDLGYFDLSVFAAMQQAGEYFLSRVQFGTGVLVAADANAADGIAAEADQSEPKAVDLLAWLERKWQAQGGGFVQQEVTLGVKQRLRCRLIAWRLPKEQADRRRAKLRQELLSKKGREPSAERLAWCDWSILVTNAPEELLAPEEAVVLYRARWQVELLFKRWKSQGLIAQLSGSTAVRQMVRMWARLLAVLVQHWLVIGSAWGKACMSLNKAGEAVRVFANRLAAGCSELLEQVLADIENVLAKTCRRNKRAEPGTLELLNDPRLLRFSLT